MAKKAKAEKTEKAPKQPKSTPLPGMEQVVHAHLNTLCEHIGENRDEMNRRRGEDKDMCQNALSYMHTNKLESYQHAGVELVKLSGEERLRVRTSKANATTAAEPVGDDQ